MAKGMFTQGVVLLTDGRTSLEDVKAALARAGKEIVKESPAHESWAFGGPSVLLPDRPDVNGYVAVDVVNHVWPDGMGDPKTDADVFGAWSMGFFGPLTFPGGLARARQHAWAWPGASSLPEGHAGFVRIRLSYGFGAEKDDLVFPADCNPLDELMFVSRLAIALLDAPGVLGYFNPNGEVLRDGPSFLETWTPCLQQGFHPFLLWMNVRYFHLNETFSVMDTVGNGQLDLQDIEAIFQKSEYDPADVDYYLRTVTGYLLELEHELTSGESIDGPGESNLSWVTEIVENGLVAPPRRVVRVYARAQGDTIRKALAALKTFSL